MNGWCGPRINLIDEFEIRRCGIEFLGIEFLRIETRVYGSLRRHCFCGDHLYTGIRENMIFSLKNNEFFNEFSMKMNDFATFFASSIHWEEQKRWFWIETYQFWTKIRWFFANFFIIIYIWRCVKTSIFHWENDDFCIKND